MRRIPATFVGVALAWSGLTGCTMPQRPVARPDYKTVSAPEQHKSEVARSAHATALRQLERGELALAECSLKDALAADVFFGPAHNTLGTIYLKQKKYYLASWEFQYAANLMPSQSAPLNNLGLVFEAVGRLDEAAGWYDKGLALAPEAEEITANLARAYVRSGRKDDRTRTLLHTVVMKDRRPEWVSWARNQLARLPKQAPTTAASQPATE